MINGAAILLVVISLATAGVWSPPPSDQSPVVKGARRVIVVEEYEQKEAPVTEQEGTTAVDERSQLHELPEVGSQEREKNPTTKERVCDALGRCKDKISGALGRAKVKASDTADEVGSAAGERLKGATESIEKAADVAREVRRSVSDKAADVAKEMGRSASDKAAELKSAADTAVDVVAEKVDNFTDIMRRGREVAVDAAAYLLRAGSVARAMRLVELLGFCAGYGTCVWITFFSSHVLAGALATNAFALVQSRIYPVYFRTMACSIGAALLPRLLWRGKDDALQSYNLVLSLVMILLNMFILEPKAAEVMFERMKLEKEEGALGGATNDAVGRECRDRINTLNERLKRLNGYSSWLNIFTLMSLSWYLVYLSRFLDLGAL